MDLHILAQQLKDTVRGVSCIDIEDLDESYMSFSDIKGVIDVLNTVAEEKYYDGWNEEAEVYVDLMLEVLAISKRYTQLFGL